MKKTRFFGMEMHHLMLRYYAMIAVTLLLGVLTTWWLTSIVAMAIAVSAILGIRFNLPKASAASGAQMGKISAGKKRRQWQKTG
jgi:hypothetical protein